MEFPIKIYTIKSEWSIVYIEGSILLYFYLCSAISAEPDERPRYAVFHLGLHCVPKYPFRGFLFSNGYTNTHA